jgi:hypothetical protein
MMKLSIFNAQGSRLIIVVVQVGAVEALRKKERQDEAQFTTKSDGFLSFNPPPPLNAKYILLNINSSKERTQEPCSTNKSVRSFSVVFRRLAASKPWP